MRTFPLWAGIWPQAGFWFSSSAPPRPSYSQSASRKGSRTVPSVGAGTHTSLFHSSPLSACPGVPRLPSAFTGGRCAAGSGRPEVRRPGGGGSGSCRRAEGRIPDCEVGAPAPGPAPPPARERGVAGPLPPQPSSPRPPALCSERAPELQPRRVEAVPERAKGRQLRDSDRPAAAADQPPRESRSPRRAGVPSAAGERGRRGGRVASGEVARAFPPLPCTSHQVQPRASRGGKACAPRLCAQGPRGPPLPAGRGSARSAAGRGGAAWGTRARWRSRRVAVALQLLQVLVGVKRLVN